MKYWSVPRCFEGRTVAVCASGPSMTQTVADLLLDADVPVIAVNKTRELLRRQGWMIYGADAAWWAHPTNADVFDEQGLKVSIEHGDESRQIERRGVGLLRRENHGYSDDPHCVTALGNSGSQAIQIAVKTGAARVLLCGFDFSGTTHWHGAHPAGLRKTDKDLYAGWARRLAEIAPALLKRCEVVNCTPGSAIDCFPRMTLEDALASRAVLAA